MPKDLKDFPRPLSDNGRGLAGSASIGWTGGTEGYDYWSGELIALGVKWFKVLDHRGDSLPVCEKLIAAGIFPIVRIIRQDPPPNDSPEPNPGHVNAAEEETIRRLIAAGVRYFETNNEPNLATEWKNGAMPGDARETAKLVALNWLFDARLILAAGGYPGLPAISVGGNMDLMGALVALGRQDILLEGCWIALHNDGMNRPLDYPDDPINRAGQPITASQYDQGIYTQWAWWHNAAQRADDIEQINTMRAAGKNPAQTIQQDHACFREFEYYNSLAMKYLGRSIPIISTEAGYRIGRRDDARYPRITPESHRDLTAALFDYMQRQAPDYYFAAMLTRMIESSDAETDAWYSSFWQRALQKGAPGRGNLPTIPVPGAALGDRLPVVDVVKAMPNLARRMPGVQPAPPPLQAPTPVTPPPPAPLKYVVMAGDTLSKIAKQFGTTWQNIAALNQIASPDLIRAGQTLLIPRPADRAPRAEPETLTPPPTRPGLSALFPDVEPTPSAPPQQPTVEPPRPVAPRIEMPPPPPPVEPPRPVVPPRIEIPPPPPVETPQVVPPRIEMPPPPPPVETPRPIAPPAPIPAASTPPPIETPQVVPPRIETPPPPPPVETPRAVVPPRIEMPPPPPVETPRPVVPPRIEMPPPPPPVETPRPVAPPAPVPAASTPPPPLVETPPPPPVEMPRPVARPAPVLPQLPKLPDLSIEPLELEWDWRLDALGVVVEPADVTLGQEYWKLVRAVYQAPDESGGNHHIYYTVLDEHGQPLANQKVWQGWPNDKIDAATDGQGKTDIPLWTSYAPDRGEYGSYSAWVDGLPSDRVIGMGLPLKRHVSFLLTWQRTFR